uniref:RRM domain-containing protein n=1 Tax=Heterosigma akashiwo TaxID=2829 RepID=A0A7S3XLQ0_HETAK
MHSKMSAISAPFFSAIGWKNPTQAPQRSPPPPSSFPSLPRPPGPRNVLFVGNLSWDTDDTALLAHFQGAAAPPQAAEVQVSATGRSKGWGLVTFAAAEDAQAAADALNRSELDGRQINVRMDRK